MTQRDNILLELNELQSSLSRVQPENPYKTPAGYFEGLAEQMLKRVRALEASTASEELGHLSPLLSTISRENVYSVPTGFFSEADDRISRVIHDGNELSPAAELESLSPLLSGLKKEMPYSIPADYFENMTPAIEPKVRVISIVRQNWFRYAAAAVVIGIIVTAGFLVFKKNTIDPNENSYAWVEKNLKKVSTDAIDNFVAPIDENTPAVAKISEEVRQLVQDVSEKDIQKFLEDVQTGDPDSDSADDMDDIFMD